MVHGCESGGEVENMEGRQDNRFQISIFYWNKDEIMDVSLLIDELKLIEKSLRALMIFLIRRLSHFCS